MTDVISDFEFKLMTNSMLDVSEVQTKIRNLIDQRKIRIPDPLRGLGYITSYWGTRTDPISHIETQFHDGIDLGVEPGTPVIAIADGRAQRREDPEGYGHYIIIDHGTGVVGVYSRYAHLWDFNVEDGALVKEGEIVGFSGNSGARTTNPHLHFSVYIGGTNTASSVNPLLFFPINMP
jgi:murein DD-endopeptidase MepM/ murein hydrolase activator NlpD